MFEMLANNKVTRVLAYITISFVSLLNPADLNAAGQELYSGTLSFVQYNDDGSFKFQLSEKGTPIVVKNPKCDKNNIFLVKNVTEKCHIKNSSECVTIFVLYF